MPEDTPAQEAQAPENAAAPAQEATPAAKTAEDNYWRRQAEKAQKELEKHQRAQMTEAEKARAERDDATRRATELEAQLRETRLRSRFETAALKAGAIDIEAAFKLANTASLKVKDDGSIEGLDQALAELKKSRPWLFAQQRTSTGTPGGATAGSSTPQDQMNQRLRDAWRR